MEIRLKNLIFISICEVLVEHYTQGGRQSFSTFGNYCQYYGSFITKDVPATKDAMRLQFTVFDYLDEIYGFSVTEAYPLIYEFFNSRKWVVFYEIAEYTNWMQKNNTF